MAGNDEFSGHAQLLVKDKVSKSSITEPIFYFVLLKLRLLINARFAWKRDSINFMILKLQRTAWKHWYKITRGINLQL